jgi:hypothetical protein
VNNSIIIIKERSVKVNIYKLYETSKSVIITIAFNITFIFKRIYISLTTFIILLNTWACALNTIVLFVKVTFLKFKEYITLTFAVKVFTTQFSLL